MGGDDDEDGDGEPDYIGVAPAARLIDVKVMADWGLVAEGMTMVIVTHEIGFAKEVGDWIIYMDEGQVVESGTPDMIASPKTERMKKFLGQILEA